MLSKGLSNSLSFGELKVKVCFPGSDDLQYLFYHNFVSGTVS